jgi:hypothetical protein
MELDQKAVNRMASIERTVLEACHPNQAEFIGIINAIELQVELGDAVHSVVHHLAVALLELARRRGLHPSQTSQLEKKLVQLQKYLTSRGRIRPSAAPPGLDDPLLRGR